MKARSAAAALVAALFCALTACAKTEAAPAMFERPPAPVRVATAVAQDVPVYLDEIGRAAAKETVWVKPEVSARVMEVHFEDGADLKRGQTLFTLDARPFEAKLASAQASLLRAHADVVRAQAGTEPPKAALDHAKSALEFARSEFSRAETLVQTNAVSRADFDAKKSAVSMAESDVKQAEAKVQEMAPEVRQAEADVAKAEADVATAKLDVEYCTIKSPIDGRAGENLVDAGNLVQSGATPLVMVAALDPIKVDFTVNENAAAAVQKNMAAGVLRVEARLPDEEADPRTGELTFVDNVVQETTGTLKLRATVPNADRRFWPGRFVKVRLVLQTLKDAVLVPAAAPQLSGKGTFVYVVKDDGTAEMRLVSVGQRQGELVVVKDGVKAGERVVVAGQLAVTPGGKVRVEEPPAAAPAPAAEPKK